MWYVAPSCRGRRKQRKARMDNKNPQKDKAPTQAFPSSVIMDNPPWPLPSAITNAISFGIILNEFADHVSVAYTDCISSIIINQSF